MAKSFNYSKWDNIELSDDESDLHPNIDKESWFRLKHRTRLEREEKEDLEVKEYNHATSEDSSRLKIISARIKAIESGKADDDAEFEDIDALKIEAKELQYNVDQRNKRIAEIQEKRKWNIDNICVVKDEKTIVNGGTTKSLKADTPLVEKDETSGESVFKKIESNTAAVATSSKPATGSATKDIASKIQQSGSTTSASSTKPVKSTTVTAAPIAKGAEPSASIQREKLAVMSYNDYVIGHEQILEDWSEIGDLEASQKFLFRHCDVLLHEHAQSYMLLSCLEDEMNGKKKRMRLVCRQSQILSHIHELGISMNRDPRDVILPFFRRIEEKEYLTGFLSAVDDFVKRIQARAVQKRKEMDADRRAEEREAGEGPPLGPGGLDPYEVLETLPEVLKDAFESQDLQRLQDVLAAMDPLEAKTHMKRCVDSGLWVPRDGSVFDDGEGDEDEEEEERKEDPQVVELGENDA